MKTCPSCGKQSDRLMRMNGVDVVCQECCGIDYEALNRMNREVREIMDANGWDEWDRWKARKIWDARQKASEVAA